MFDKRHAYKDQQSAKFTIFHSFIIFYFRKLVNMIPWSYSLLASSPFKASEASQPPHVLASSVSRAAFVWLLATAPNRELARKLPWTKKQISSKTEEKIKKRSLRKHKERDLLLVNQSTSPRGYFLIWPIKDVPLDKVWFFTAQLCHKQGI